MRIVISGPIGKDGGIKQFSATGAFPGVKRTDKIVKLLGKHATFTTRTMHGIPPDYQNNYRESTSSYVPISHIICLLQ
jgi:hypothetical protein